MSQGSERGRGRGPDLAMTAAHDYEHLHHLVGRLSPTQVRRLRLILTEDEELSQVDQQVPDTTGEDSELFTVTVGYRP
jgi:hypothetical protein